jgi:hypothetical protein
MRTRKSIAQTDNLHTKNPPKRQLIGEQLGPKRMIERRLFQTSEEAEIWARAAPDRRFRLARIGSAAWQRALDEELRTAQRAECAQLPNTNAGPKRQS